MNMGRLQKKKVIYICRILVPLLIALMSFIWLSKISESPKIHEKTITTLQTKQETILKLSAASATVAASASLLLGERANAVSNKLLDLTGYFIIILCAIMLEKYLVTIMGFVSFKLIVPIACIIFSIFTIIDKEAIRKLALKLFVFAIVAFLVIPFSVTISNLIEKTYTDVNIQNTLIDSENLSKEIESTKENIDNGVVVNEQSNNIAENNDEENNPSGSGNVFESIGNFFGGVKENVVAAVGNVVSVVTDKANEIIDKLTKQLNNMIEAIAVMLVTTCVIPILIIFFFIWIVKMIFSINISVDSKMIPKLSSFKE